jgi:hypothetical protein
MPDPDYDLIARRLAHSINQTILDHQYARRNVDDTLEDLAQEIRLFLLALTGQQHEINKALLQLTHWIEREFKSRTKEMERQ